MKLNQVILMIDNSEWLTANGRYHWADKAARTRRLRERAAWLAKQKKHLITPVNKARIVASIGYASKRRVDPANAAPTVKAIIDGLVDAGVFKDDDSTHLVGVEFRLDPELTRKGTHRVRLDIEAVE